MNNLSEVQKQILDKVKENHNVIVEACAGAGKSTTILSIAKELEKQQFLQLTYNSSLRTEIKEKVKSLTLENLKIHTYHSLAVRFYLSTAYTDTGIKYILYNSTEPVVPIPKFDIIVIDEAQDMTMVYYQFVCKFITDMCKDSAHKVQLLILGDVMQGLYEFKGSDTRFLSLAKPIWGGFPFLKTNEFSKCTMRMSYRITNQMCNFVNTVMLGENRMDACRDGEPVKYIRNSRTNIEKTVIYEINVLLQKGVKPNEIFILGSSVKGSNSNIRKMENALVKQGIPCHVPMIESDKIDERVIEGKVVFSTFHCVKGRQRKYVFIIGFDNSYLNFFARNLPRDICPNTLYVGATRATHGLYLLESDNFATDRPLEFLKMNHHEMKSQSYIHFKGQPRMIFYTKDEESGGKFVNIQEKHYITPTELIKFIPESVIEDISPILDRIFIKETTGYKELDIPNIVETRQGFFEEVSDLNGIAIPSMYYDFINNFWEGSREPETNRNILHEMILQNIASYKQNEHEYLRNIVKELPDTIDGISDYLYLANIYVATQEKLYFKLKQIERDEYRWLTDSIFENCKGRLQDTIGKECQVTKPWVEQTIIHNSMDEEHSKIDEFLSQHFDSSKKFRFTARVDLITEPTIWELKCTSKISIDHLLQVVIYAWLWRMTNDDNKYFKIFNIKTGELLELRSTMDELHTIMIALLKGKYLVQPKKSDEDFVLDCIFS